ncbi:MAG: hypothetical protein WAL64_00050 [Candidatus Dormiibacterota bacterium]
MPCRPTAASVSRLRAISSAEPAPNPAPKPAKDFSGPLLVLGFGLASIPIGIYFWYVRTFGVNIVFQDSWNGTLPLVRAFANGQLTLAQLWAPHNGNRMLFPNLVLTISDVVNRVDSKTDMYLSAVAVLAALALLVGLCATTTPARGLWVLPAAFLLCDLIQVENILWAFQFAFALGMLCLLLTLASLEGSNRHRWLFAVALAAAVVASYTSLFGLLVWPVGLLYGALKGLRRRYIGAWVLVAAAATWLYFRNLGPIYPVTHPSYLVANPILGLRFLLILLGDVSPVHRFVVGLAILGASIVVGLLALHYRVPAQRMRLALGLWTFGLLFDLLVTGGRAELGLSYAQSSRYSTFNILVIIGIYLGAVSVLEPTGGWRHLVANATQRPLAAGVSAALVALIAAQVAWSIPNGVVVGQHFRANREEGVRLLRHYHAEPAPLLARYLFGPSGQYVKEWAPILQHHDWSVFS